MPPPSPAPPINPDWITREQAAAILGVSAKTMERRDRLGLGPVPVRLGRRCVRYSRQEAESLAATAATL